MERWNEINSFLFKNESPVITRTLCEKQVIEATNFLWQKEYPENLQVRAFLSIETANLLLTHIRIKSQEKKLMLIQG